MSRSKELILLAQRIRALSQTGVVYSLSEYDTERYEELSRLSDEITALATGLKPDDVASGYRPAQEYVTPKVDIRAVVFNEKDEILLVREKMDGCWSLPGGWSDVGYSPKEVAAKEVKEETGLDVLPVRLLAVMDMSKHPHPAIPYYVYKFFILNPDKHLCPDAYNRHTSVGSAPAAHAPRTTGATPPIERNLSPRYRKR